MLAAWLLVGCSPSERTNAVAVETPTTATAAETTSGGDGAEIRLDELTEADLREAALNGELACSFTRDKAAAPLLHAMGIVGSADAAQGVVKVASYVERIGAPGGFNGMVKGATFTGKGKTIEVVLTGPATEGGESPPQPATLTYQRADGASRAFDGLWQCGP